MLTVYYSPHATSVDNEAGRASGHADVPLAEQGRQQARTLGGHYAAIPVGAVFCSDLRRAVDTAALICGDRAAPLIPDARLREFDYGTMTQWPRAEVEAEFPRRITTPFPGGESLLLVVERVGAFLRDTLADYDGKTIVVDRPPWHEVGAGLLDGAPVAGGDCPDAVGVARGSDLALRS